MTCFKPLTAYYSSSVNPTGKRSIVFKREKSLDPNNFFYLACGQCKGCRLDRKREWAVRIFLENLLSNDSIFLTLTYDNEHLPEDGSLHPDHMQDFMKNLRRQVEYHYGKKIRFFLCGEYGEQFNRPHYHAIIYGFRPPDAQRYNSQLFTSRFLEKIWKNGFCPFGDVTYESAAYVASYVIKKITGKLAAFWYDGLQPEFVRMSRRPGIGKEFFEKYQSDVLKEDAIVVRDGLKVPVPKYFNKLIEEYYPEYYEHLKAVRLANSREDKLNCIIERDMLDKVEYVFKKMQEDENLFDGNYDYAEHSRIETAIDNVYRNEILPIKEEIAKAKLSMKKRGYENGNS